MNDRTILANDRLLAGDLPLFRAVELLGWKTACHYSLPLHTIQPAKQQGEKNAFGTCSRRGKIHIVIRRRRSRSGEWAKSPLSSKEILDTLAHELAHLHAMNHRRKWRKLFQQIRHRLLDPDENFISELDNLRRMKLPTL